VDGSGLREYVGTMPDQQTTTPRGRSNSGWGGPRSFRPVLAQFVKVTSLVDAGQAAAQRRDGRAAPLPPRLAIVRHLRRRVHRISLSKSAAESVIHEMDGTGVGCGQLRR
jgi:hypothetical protein